MTGNTGTHESPETLNFFLNIGAHQTLETLKAFKHLYGSTLLKVVLDIYIKPNGETVATL